MRWEGSDFEEGEESLSYLHEDDEGVRQRYFMQKVKQPDVLKENYIGLSMGDRLSKVKRVGTDDQICKWWTFGNRPAQVEEAYEKSGGLAGGEEVKKFG